MKRISLFILLSVLALALSACGFVSFTSPNTIVGSGKVVSETRQVSGFTRASFDGSFEVYLTQGSEFALTLEGEDNILPLVETKVSGDKLTVGFKPNTSISSSRPVVVRLTAPDISLAEINGSGKIFCDALQTKSIDLSINGSGEINFKAVQADALNAHISGSGSITAAGQAAAQTVKIDGSGKFSGGELAGQSADVRIAGSGNITVNAADTLKVLIEGSGSVRYYGRPQISQTINGSGSINPEK